MRRATPFRSGSASLPASILPGLRCDGATVSEDGGAPLFRPRRSLNAPPQACCRTRSEEHTSELQSQSNLVCRLLLEKKKKLKKTKTSLFWPFPHSIPSSVFHATL